jgi:23S rRNA (pseudouridine1915-N3)-methyltransferase
MRIQIIAVGKKMPEWVISAYQEFSKRLPRDFKVLLTEISPAKRNVSRKSADQLCEEEWQQIQAALLPNAYTIALDFQGELWSTSQLAKKLEQCSAQGLNINFLIGGPDGLSKSCLDQSQARLSLSKMVFPHPLVRVILIEQLYRAYCLLHNLPYAKH